MPYFICSVERVCVSKPVCVHTCILFRAAGVDLISNGALIFGGTEWLYQICKVASDAVRDYRHTQFWAHCSQGPGVGIFVHGAFLSFQIPS
jgi:hypothetical protein